MFEMIDSILKNVNNKLNSWVEGCRVDKHNK